MSDGIDLEDLESAHEEAPDFRRGASGAPLVTNPDNPAKRKQYSRCSSLGKTLDDDSALTNWRIDRAIEGVAARPELQASIVASPQGKAHTELREKAISAGRGAFKADLGTAFHKMTDRWEQEEDFDPGPPYRAALEAFKSCRDDLGMKPQRYEVAFVNDEYHSAGTADRLDEVTKPLLTPAGTIIRPGELLVTDTKTGENLYYSLPTYTMQTYLYASGVFYDVVEERRLETPEINQEWGILWHANVEEATCEAIWVDLQVGKIGVQMAEDVREWRRNWRRKNGFQSANVEVELAPVEAVRSKPDLPPLKMWRDSVPEVPDLEISDLQERAQERLLKIRDAGPEVMKWMKVRWPEDVKPPKKVETYTEATELHEFLDRVEDQFQLPFMKGLAS